jgi:hypothetical protein
LDFELISHGFSPHSFFDVKKIRAGLNPPYFRNED